METKDFIKRAEEKHNKKYDYSQVEYINRDKKVCIICPDHGEFWQTPKNHLKGCGCPKCSGSYKPTTEEWIKKAKEVHKDRYDYSKVVYKSNKDKVCIICPDHGEFWQIAGNHLNGEGCVMCRNEKLSSERNMTKEEFIKRSREIHGDKYNYNKVVYKNNVTKVCIICPNHGEFYITPVSHLNGVGCSECKKELKKPEKEKVKVDKKAILKESYLSRFRELYGDKYTYGNFDYVDSKTKIAITCPEHGVFYKTLSKHLYQGCPLCCKDKLKNSITGKTESYIERAKEIHGDKYDYSETLYNGGKIKIICHSKDINGLEHGFFYQDSSSHLSGCGCPKCAQEIRTMKQTKSTEDFIKRAIEKYPEFDYSEAEYVNNTTPLKIICHKKNKKGKEHGNFYVTPNKILGRGTNCPYCSKFTSKPEIEIYNFIKELIGEKEVIYHDRTILGNKNELDIYLPNYKVAFEFNGLYWHSDKITHITKKYHLEKTQICEEKGIHLIQIFSDEYFEHKDIVLAKIRHILGKCDKMVKIQARKCEVKEIEMTEAREFLNKNHIQGFAVSTIYLGAFYNEQLIGVMSFLRENSKTNDYCLNRFATDINVICSGIGGKLFKYFTKTYSYGVIKSFADRRWSFRNKNIYIMLGFKEDKVIPPDYRYININKPSSGRLHKFNFRKQRLHRKYNLPLTMTESEMTKELGYYKIYDCGLIRYVWKNEN